MAGSVCDDDLSDVSQRLRSVSRHLRRLHVRLRARFHAAAMIKLVVSN